MATEFLKALGAVVVSCLAAAPLVLICLFGGN